MKDQKGITLIALVITIIVMLILVAVSVSYGIQSGLFTKARQGQASWEEQQSIENNANLRTFLDESQEAELSGIINLD